MLIVNNMNVEKPITNYRHTLRERILHEAMGAFMKQGIRAVKMDDIASRLAISKRTLYELYANKEDLLMEGVTQHHQCQLQDMHDYAATGANVMDILLHAFQQKVKEINETNPQFYSDIEKYPRLVEYLESHKVADQEQFIQFLRRGVAEGYFCEGPNYELIANIVNMQSRYVMAQQLYRKHSMRGVFYNLIYISLRGLCTHKGMEVVDAFLADYHKNK